MGAAFGRLLEVGGSSNSSDRLVRPITPWGSSNRFFFGARSSSQPPRGGRQSCREGQAFPLMANSSRAHAHSPRRRPRSVWTPGRNRSFKKGRALQTTPPLDNYPAQLLIVFFFYCFCLPTSEHLSCLSYLLGVEQLPSYRVFFF